MARVLNRAGAPLTESQIEQLKAIERGPGARETITDILTDEQKEALESLRQKRGGKSHPGMRMGKIFDEAGCPLTDEQREQIRSLEPGLSRREAAMDILTDEQKAVLEKHFNTGESEPVEKVTAVDEEQKPFNAIKNIYPNPFNPSTTISYIIADRVMFGWISTARTASI